MNEKEKYIKIPLIKSVERYNTFNKDMSVGNTFLFRFIRLYFITEGFIYTTFSILSEKISQSILIYYMSLFLMLFNLM